MCEADAGFPFLYFSSVDRYLVDIRAIKAVFFFSVYIACEEVEVSWPRLPTGVPYALPTLAVCERAADGYCQRCCVLAAAPEGASFPLIYR